MPDNAPRIKVDGVRRNGGEIVFVGPANVERVARAHEIADRDGLELVSSANDVRVVAGQGTLGVEIVEQLAELGEAEASVVLVPVGLGGLAAGVSLAVKSLRPDAHVFGVEPSSSRPTRTTRSPPASARLGPPTRLVGRWPTVCAARRLPRSRLLTCSATWTA